MAGRGGRVVVDQELIRVITRIRELTSKGYTLKDIEKLTGWSSQRVWNVQNGVRHKRVTMSLNDLKMKKPSSSGILCRRCGEPGRIFCESGLCVQCELFELAKVGICIIDEPNKG